MIKKYIFIPLFFLIVLQTQAQDDFTARWEAAYKLTDENEFDEALKAYEILLVEQPSFVDTHVQVSWCYLMKNDMESAMLHAQAAYNLDLFSASAYAINAYLMYIAGYEEAGMIYLNNSIWLLPNDDDINYFFEDLADMKAKGLDVAALETELNSIKNQMPTRNKEWEMILGQFVKGVEQIGENDLGGAKITFKEALNGFDKAPVAQQRLAFPMAYLVGTHYYSAGDSSNYVPLISGNLKYMRENSKTSYVPLIHMTTLLGEHYYNNGQYEKSFEILYDGLDFLPFINKFKYLGSYSSMFLLQYSKSANAVGNVTEARDAAQLVIETQFSGFDEWYETNGWILLAQAWGQDEAQAKEHYKRAFDLAEQYGFEDLKISIADFAN